ncbi:hypothetical protein D3C76_1334180 [compost metagenome]
MPFSTKVKDTETDTRFVGRVLQHCLVGSTDGVNGVTHLDQRTACTLWVGRTDRRSNRRRNADAALFSAELVVVAFDHCQAEAIDVLAHQHSSNQDVGHLRGLVVGLGLAVLDQVLVQPFTRTADTELEVAFVLDVRFDLGPLFRRVHAQQVFVVPA